MTHRLLGTAASIRWKKINSKKQRQSSIDWRTPVACLHAIYATITVADDAWKIRELFKLGVRNTQNLEVSPRRVGD
jgi:hypothetical protein